MTIQVTQSSVSYVGDDVQTVFAYNFRIFQDENLKVYLDGVLQTYITDYTVTNNGDESGGTVVFVVPPPAPTASSDGIVTIERVLSNTQLLDLIEYDRFPAESVEAALDYIVLLVQQNTRATDRSIRAGVGNTADLTFPNPGAGQFIKYTDDGLALETADINDLGDTIVSEATDQEIIDGIQTQKRLISPAQVKLGTDTHQDPPVTSVFDSQFHEVVDVLPPTPEASKIYLVRQ
jgi:hypothetical protein